MSRRKPTKTRTAQGLRRKAYRLRRKADAARNARRVWDASTFAQRATDLEHLADELDEQHAADDIAAGFFDDDLASVAATTVQCRGGL